MQSEYQFRTSQMSADTVSDRMLSAGLLRRDTSALSSLYDRYSPLVFTLLCDAEPEAAEALLQDVFVELWHKGLASLLTDLLPTLLQLTAEVVVRHRAAQGRTAGAVWGQPLLPALAPFSLLPKFVFDVMVLTRLGGLTVSELAVALECDESAIVRGLSVGFAALRAELRTGHMS
jgi:hypothetical protein